MTIALGKAPLGKAPQVGYIDCPIIVDNDLNKITFKEYASFQTTKPHRKALLEWSGFLKNTNLSLVAKVITTIIERG